MEWLSTMVSTALLPMQRSQGQSLIIGKNNKYIRWPTFFAFNFSGRHSFFIKDNIFHHISSRIPPLFFPSVSYLLPPSFLPFSSSPSFFLSFYLSSSSSLLPLFFSFLLLFINPSSHLSSPSPLSILPLSPSDHLRPCSLLYILPLLFFPSPIFTPPSFFLLFLLPHLSQLVVMSSEDCSHFNDRQS